MKVKGVPCPMCRWKMLCWQRRTSTNSTLVYLGGTCGCRRCHARFEPQRGKWKLIER